MRNWILQNLKYVQTSCLRCIWDQKVYFWNIPSDADIYWYNKINPMLLTAFCLLLTLCCSLLFVYNSVLNGACMLGVNTNVSVN